MSYPYQDHATAAPLLLTGPCARGAGEAWFVALTQPLDDIDVAVGGLHDGLVDIEQAAGVALDLAGELEGEEREGLDDREFRRIVAGRRMARNAITAPRVWAGWLALTGSTTADMRVLAPASLYLTAQIPWVPTSTWLVRAGSVVRSLIGADAQANAVVYRSTSALFDEVPGFDLGRFAYTLRVQGAQ